jgi:hypothetical protein
MSTSNESRWPRGQAKSENWKCYDEFQRKYESSRRRARKLIEKRDLINDTSAWREAHQLLDTHAYAMTSWERDFVSCLQRFEFLSSKQHAVLRRLLFSAFVIPKGRRKR